MKNLKIVSLFCLFGTVAPTVANEQSKVTAKPCALNEIKISTDHTAFELLDYKEARYVKAKNEMISSGLVTEQEFQNLQETCLDNQHAMLSQCGSRIKSLEAINESPDVVLKNSPAGIRTDKPGIYGFYGNPYFFDAYGHNRCRPAILSEKCFNLVSIIAKRKQMSIEETRTELRTKETELAELKQKEQRRSALSRFLDRS